MLETERQFGNDINAILECYGIEDLFIVRDIMLTLNNYVLHISHNII